MADNNDELDKIIREGKSNSSAVAMAVFAVELRTVKDNVAEVKKLLEGDDRKFALKEDVVQLRAIIYAFFGIITVSFIAAVAKGVFK